MSRVLAWARTLAQHISRHWSVRANVHVGHDVHIGPMSVLWAPRTLVVEPDVYIGKFCTIEVNGAIGAGSMIANSVGIVGRRDHDMRCVGRSIRRSPWVGDEGAQFSSDAVLVGRDVWVGYGAIILAPVVIGRGAVVAAGAVVTSDVEPYSIVAGNPAAKIGCRFTEEERVRHEAQIDGSE